MERKSRCFGVALVYFAVFGLLPSLALTTAFAQAPADGDGTADEMRAKRDAFETEAHRLYGERKFKEAIEAAERMLATERAWLDAGAVDIGGSLITLADYHEMLGDWEDAQKLRQEYLAWTKEYHKDQAWRVADGDRGLAWLRQLRALSKDDWKRWRDAEMEAYDINQRMKTEPVSAEIIASYKHVMDVDRDLFGAVSETYAKRLVGLAQKLQDAGQFAEALKTIREAVDVRKKLLGGIHPDVAYAVIKMGTIYESLNDYARAESLYRESLEVSKEVVGEKDPLYATNLNNLAKLYWLMGDYARAEPLYLQALEIDRIALGETDTGYAIEIHNLAALYKGMGDYERAEPLYRQSLEIVKEALGEKHPLYAQFLDNLAEAYQSMGDYAQAEPLYREALEIFKKVLGKKHPLYATSLNNLAGVYCSMGDFARAEPLYQEAREICGEVLGEKHPYYATSVSNVAWLNDLMGASARAEPLYQQALAIAGELVDAAAVAQDETAQLQFSKSVAFYRDSYLSFLLRRSGDPEAAYKAVLRSKGATLLRQRAARLASDNEELAPLLADLQMVTRQWSALATGGPLENSQWKGRLAALTNRKQQLEEDLSARSALFRTATAKVQTSQVARALPAEAALVDYLEFVFTEPLAEKPGQFKSRRSYLALVVRPDGSVKMFDLGKTAPIDDAIDQWRAGFGATAEGMEAGRLLREKLWTPLETAIGDAKLMLISPDGALGKLPFGALPGKKEVNYLIEEVAISLIPVPRLIPEIVAGDTGGDAKALAAKALQHELLVVGGVDYDNRDVAAVAATVVNTEGKLAESRQRGEAQRTAEGLHWGLLSGTGREATAIEELFESEGGAGRGAVAALTGAGATEEQFRALAPHCRVLHVATHGFFAPAAKRSALATAAPKDGAPLGSALGDGLSTGLNGTFPPGLLSGLVLAGANNPPALPEDPQDIAKLPEDGILTAEELALLPLGHMQLAVLSACETGLGEVAGGEGLLGIQRAFQVAGVRTTVASLWKVDDAATQKLMTKFYGHLLKDKQSPLNALRNAQLEILREGRSAKSASGNSKVAEGERGANTPEGASSGSNADSPYWWAAFTLSGDWQ